MPVGHVFVGDSRGDIKHDNATLAVNVVPVAKTTKFFLSSRIPNVECDFAVVLEWVLICQWLNILDVG